jgi:hypothetical protein
VCMQHMPSCYTGTLDGVDRRATPFQAAPAVATSPCRKDALRALQLQAADMHTGRIRAQGAGARGHTAEKGAPARGRWGSAWA